jgi:hypothetical protein
MVSNSNNIKKNEQSPLTSNQRAQINTMPNGVGNPGSVLRQTQKCIGVEPVNWTTIPL